MNPLLPCALGMLLPVFSLTAAPPLPEALADLDARVEKAQKQFEVPGVAIAIVKDGAVIFEKGYGLREAGKPEPVDGHTLFAIASNTKAFTAAMLAILVDEGKIAWEDRVTDRLPWFAMSDPYVTREMTIRDLLVHRSGLGLGAGDLLFWPATSYTTKEIVQRLRHVPLATSFRSTYAYDNILYAAAGLVLEEVTGVTWAELVKQKIFGPVGMTESKPGCGEIPPGSNVVKGHVKFDFKELRTVPDMTWDNNPAAGGIYSNVHDMAKWIRVQLEGGMLPAVEGKEAARLFSHWSQEEMWSVVTPMPISPASVPELAPLVPNFKGYGLGWTMNDYHGRRIVTHTGGWPGQSSRVTLVPAERLGIVVLTNQEEGAGMQSLTCTILDGFLGVPATDWTAAYAEALKKGAGGAEESWQKRLAARDTDSKPSLPLEKYAGTYRDAWYGDVIIGQKDGALTMQFSKSPQLTGTLEAWQHDTFLVRWLDRSLNADAFASFTLTPDGNIRELRMEAVSPLTDFSFDFHDLRLVPQ